MKTAVFEDGKHEYDYEELNGQHILYYSDNDLWIDPGEMAFEIEDTGNGVKFKGLELDYSELSQLHILLKSYFADTRIQKANLELL